MLKSSVRVASLAALCLWILPDLAQAAEVRLTAPDAGDGFADRLRSASLTITTAAQQEATAQDLLAAAQSDYGRLIGVLYAEGFYGGVIRILVDGQEAASIPPLRAPSDIRQIDITVERNAPFVFSTARVAPLAPKTKLPPEFVTGNRAKGDLIGDATRSSIAAWRTTGHAKALVSEQTIIADHAASTLSADIQLDPGPRLHRLRSGVTLTAPDILTGASQSQGACAETLALFLEILGAVMGNLALTHMATGGVFLIGGLARAMAPLLNRPEFRQVFVAKGPYRPIMEAMPIHLITEDTAALIGCARYLRQRLK